MGHSEKLANENGRRALLIFSDGEDNSSSHNMMTAIETAQSDKMRGRGGSGQPMQATNGTFYGLTSWGGPAGKCDLGKGCGVIFSLSVGLPPFVEANPGFGAPGHVVDILGNNLAGTTSVTFNGTPAAFDVRSGTRIMTSVPNGATAGTIEVTTPSGTLKSNVAFQILP